jgi:hypothetical protein
MKRFIVSAAGALVVTLIIILEIALPKTIRSRLQDAVEDGCADCRLEIDKVDASLFSLGRIGLHGLKMHTGKAGSAEVETLISDVWFKVVLTDLVSKKLHLEYLDVQTPKVTYIDGDGMPSPKKAKEGEDEKIFSVDECTVKQGQFTYVRNTHGTHAKLLVHDITIDLSRVSNDSLFEDEKVTAKVRAQVERTGTADLIVTTLPFSDSLVADVDLRVRDQNLRDLTSFLSENAGVDLSGILVKGHSVIRMRGNKETAQVVAEYHDVKVKVKKAYDRSELEAFLTSLGANLTMSEDNLEKSDANQKRSVEYVRKPGQSIVAFAVQGMKEAAIKVAQAK